MFKQRDLLKAIIETTSDMISVLDRKGKICYASPNWRDFLGYTAEQMIGRYPWEFYFRDEVLAAKERIARILEKGPIPNPLEVRVMTNSGDMKHVRVNTTPLYDDKGRIEYLIGVMRDLTAEKELEGHVDKAMETEICGFVIHREGTIIRASAGAAKISGYMIEELEGTSILDLVPGYRIAEARKTIEMKPEFPRVAEIKAKDGRVIKILSEGKNIQYQGLPARFCCVIPIEGVSQGEDY